ncbi:hypothetical protein Zmor_004519 [Zophobas morio]|uniref:DUF7788 domain-containing protein n=1 Tax=Zophobas morio TaxID=2755281 RepID=A0AA38HHR8_9CUCU|nr:hypothetical protein Zmor_004519 [Zophobas morio]
MPWGGNANIDAVFTLKLNICVAQNLNQEHIPKKLFIFIDMEFNKASAPYTNIQWAKLKFAEYGYALPQVAFWQLCDCVNSNNCYRERSYGIWLPEIS